ncbi:putative non-specific serine/threonine protein kinase [Helianthus annuus]|uniref:non-specific serine/threonine protein kinase n=1 Tax=Helianthus annuus TaxID=4232 RepID=A0A251S7T0_HELAN|nr:putative non-specific serine/threonine protein kinase [Helianthus annuus]KAJ0450823.1 putative non-specific serine/threonine protein kinase [Helianthus annuus]KAJ0455129.1 putative non-specific serine/threonine protein kinase [Helianthus annuus]KAJ0472687.1 putative non-specific serine/threonine protein kinase [Helianthus annuus]KAJ0630003.1 putative non-specific serine/threonine protein kinase [Helianthus annuus]
MTEVLKALQELNVCWKKIGHYNMKCRWAPGNNSMQSNPYFGDELSIVQTDGALTTPNVLKFEVQLYKTRQDKYLLDLQRIQGT